MLYIVATPIGNLEDISQRALRILSEVDFILCEDTRVSRKLLTRFDITTPIFSYHQHSKLSKTNRIIELLRDGKDIALISDAGTPGISDPGGMLIEEVLKSGIDTSIIPIPGPSAVTAAASISGLPMEKFLFMGFPPKKKKRRKFFEEVVSSKHPVIFYESPYRIIKSLRDLRGTIAEQNAEQTRKVVVCRELTKKFEIIYRGNIGEVLDELQKDKIRGEFVVIVK